MKKVTFGSVALALACGSVTAAGFASPASAACIATPEYAAFNPANSSNFNASVNCDGLFVAKNGNAAEVRGWYNDGTWKQSSYQWVLVGSGAQKIVGQTVNGRRLRIEGRTSSYNIAASY